MILEKLKNSKYFQFVEGNWNYIKNTIDELPEDKKEIIEKRMDICLQCPLLKVKLHKNIFTGQEYERAECSECGCTYPNLTFSYFKECPVGKWKTVEEELEESNG